MDIECNSDKHNELKNQYGYPSMIIWVFGIPIIEMMLLIANRDNLDKDSVKKKLGFLYIGLELKKYYWYS
jgi:hypothetical protein